MMLIIDVIYTKPIEVIDQHLAAHRDFLQRCYDAGQLLASGPKNPRNGGCIIALTDRATMDNLIQQDPFHIHECAEYTITEFEPVKWHAAIKELCG